MKVKLSLSCEASLIALECYENKNNRHFRHHPVNTTVNKSAQHQTFNPGEKTTTTTNQALPVRSNGGQHASPDFLDDTFDFCYLVLQRSVLLGLGVVSNTTLQMVSKDKPSSTFKE
jgi:hypothetical protein